MSDYRFLIDEQLDGERLDKGLSLLTDDSFSRSFLQKLIKDKKVLVPGFSPGSGRIESKIEGTCLG